MRDRSDRLIARAAAQAADAYATQVVLGDLVWSTGDGRRCHVLGDVLTLTGGRGPDLRYQVAGVDLSQLR